MNCKIEYCLRNARTGYYLLDDECGFFNSFTRLSDAIKACKEVSLKLHIPVRVSVTLDDITYENGKDVSCSLR